jgi:H+/Na+-translocating ferredoxin:NAD+ oxidoreductase subunit B
MTNKVYKNLAEILDRLPGGFPETRTGVEITILQKLFNKEEAGLAISLRPEKEAVETIADRAGIEGREAKNILKSMYKKGLIEAMFDKTGIKPKWKFSLMPFVVGFYEEQRDTMDHDLAHLFEHYWAEGGATGIMKYSPALHRVMPAQGTVKKEYILPYDEIVPMIERSEYFEMHDCICRKQQELLNKRKCDFSLDMCMALIPVKQPPGPKSITKQQALDALQRAEEEGLVHTVSNVSEGVYYICNCCGCCCGILRGITEFGLENSVAKANYLAIVDNELCPGCGICLDRCQINAITLVAGVAVVNESSCIGCGLCVSTCGSDVMHLERKPDASILVPPENKKEWGAQRLKNRGL